MNTTRILSWGSIVAIVIGILVAMHYANTQHAVQKSSTQAPVIGTAAVGAKAPEFSAATTHGYFDLAKTNKPVFLEVFATWCPHCQRETAIVDRLYAHYKNRVDFVAVTGSNVGMDHESAESEQDVLTFAQMFHAQYPLAFDGSMQVAKEYLQGGFPTLVVIDRNKTVTYITSGETSYDELAAALNNVLK